MSEKPLYAVRVMGKVLWCDLDETVSLLSDQTAYASLGDHVKEGEITRPIRLEEYDRLRRLGWAALTEIVKIDIMNRLLQEIAEAEPVCEFE